MSGRYYLSNFVIRFWNARVLTLFKLVNEAEEAVRKLGSTECSTSDIKDIATLRIINFDYIYSINVSMFFLETSLS